LVTSPAPKAEEPVPVKRPSPAPLKLTTKAEPAAKLFAHESSPEARAKALKKLDASLIAPPEPPRMNAAERKTHPNKPVISRRTREKDKADGETRTEFEIMVDEEVRTVGRRFRRVVLVLLTAAAAVGFYIHQDRNKAPGNLTTNPAQAAAGPVMTAEFIDGGWEVEARRVLRDFLNANTSLGKAEHILRGEDLLPELEEFERRGLLFDGDTPEEDFQPQSLPRQDRKRGIFLMTWHGPDPSEILGPDHRPRDDTPIIDSKTAASAPTEIQAFFKQTPQGLKLDWEVFVQTKHRRLLRFAAEPKPGTTMTFRALIAQSKHSEGGAEAQTITYLVSDPANRSDIVKAICRSNTPAAGELARLNWVGIENRSPTTLTATIDLSWGGTEEQPQLVISRFHSWEFLGLGGN